MCIISCALVIFIPNLKPRSQSLVTRDLGSIGLFSETTVVVVALSGTRHGWPEWTVRLPGISASGLTAVSVWHCDAQRPGAVRRERELARGCAFLASAREVFPEAARGMCCGPSGLVGPFLSYSLTNVVQFQSFVEPSYNIFHNYNTCPIIYITLTLIFL